MALGSPPSARARDWKLWPLFRYRSNEATGEVRLNLLGPLVEYRSGHGRRELVVRPLLWIRQSPAGRDDRTVVAYPLLTAERGPDSERLRLALLSYRSRFVGHPTEPPGWRSHLDLYPFVFYRHDPLRGGRISVLPFYVHLEDFLGFSEVRMVAFPAYVMLGEPRVVRRWFLFPFFSAVGGPDGRGVRLWPLWGWREIAGRGRLRFVLWPFYIKEDRFLPGGKTERRRVLFPLYASTHGPGYRSRSYGPLLFYTHTVDERLGVEYWGFPWPLAVRQRELGSDSDRLFRIIPFFGYRDAGGISARFYLWPLYRHRAQDAPGYHYERRDILLLAWRRQEEVSAATRQRRRLTTIFPLLRSEHSGRRREGQVPALLDSLMPRNEALLAVDAPLWGVFRWWTGPSGTLDWELLWGMLGREGGHWVAPWRFTER